MKCKDNKCSVDKLPDIKKFTQTKKVVNEDDDDEERPEWDWLKKHKGLFSLSRNTITYSTLYTPSWFIQASIIQSSYTLLTLLT